MFDGLDAIPWAQLRQPYGTAEDIPVYLRLMLSPRRLDRKRGLHGFYMQLEHQGWSESATPPAVPYLIELLQAPQVPETAALLERLTVLTTVRDYWEGREAQIEEQADAQFRQRLRNSIAACVATRAATRTGMPVYATLLADARRAVRMQAAILLSHFTERQPEIRAILQQALLQEHDAILAGHLLYLLGQTTEGWDAANEFFAVRSAEATDPLLQLYAALGWLQCDATTIPDQTIIWLNDTLTATSDDLKQRLQRIRSYHLGELWGSYLSALYQLPAERLQRLAPNFMARLPDLDVMRAFAVATLLFTIAFPAIATPAVLPLDAATLTPRQRAVLTSFVHSDNLWGARDIDFLNLMKAYGISDSRQALGELLGSAAVPVAPPTPPQIHAAADEEAPGYRTLDAADTADPLIPYRDAIQARFPLLTLAPLRGLLTAQSTRFEQVEAGNEPTLLFHFAHTAEDRATAARQIALQYALRGRLPLAIPEPAYVALDAALPFWGYPKLDGTTDAAENFHRQPDDEATEKDLSTFLRALHTIPLSELPQDLPKIWSFAEIMELHDRAMALPLSIALADAVDWQFANFTRLIHETPPALTLVHGHLRTNTILGNVEGQGYSGVTIRLTGITDLAAAGLWDPALDLGALLCDDYPGNANAVFRSIAEAYGANNDLLARCDFYAGWWCLRDIFATSPADERKRLRLLADLEALWT